MQHRGVWQRVHVVLAVQLVGPAGTRHHAHRRVGRPALGQQPARQRAQLLARHVEDLAVGAARGAQLAVLRHGRAEGHAAAAAAARQRAAGCGGGGQRGGHAGHHLAVDAGCGQRLQLFFEPAEQARVAALQPHHAGVLARHAHQQRVDRGLVGGAGKAALADVDPARRGASSRSAGSVRASNSTTSAAASARAPRTVIRSAAPGPAPMKTDEPHGCSAALTRPAARRWCGCCSGRRRSARRPTRLSRIGLQRQRLLQLDDHTADVVDGQFVRVGGLQRADVQAVADRRRCVPAPSGCRGAPGTCGR